MHWERLTAGETGIAPITFFDTGDYRVKVGAEVKGFEPRKMVPQRKALKVMARDIQLGTAAAKLAKEHADLDLEQVNPERFGVVLGAGLITSDIDELCDAVVAARHQSPHGSPRGRDRTARRGVQDRRPSGDP